MRILVIEDEAPIASVVKRGLQEEGYQVEVALDGRTGFDKALHGDYSAIVLDLMLPGMSGLDLCRELRSRRVQTPLLMLTARGEIGDKVKGLELGADDYLPKPFDFEELLARVRALIRRDKVNRGRLISIGSLQIDTKTHLVRNSDKDVALTRQEYLLLEALARHEGRTLSREFVTETVWLNEDTFSNSVDVHIASLRRKIDAIEGVKLIHTVHREGYVLRRPAEGA